MLDQSVGFRPEEEFFALLARSRLSSDQSARALELLRRGLNWQVVQRLCRRFNLWHMIGFHLRSPQLSGAVPKDVLGRFGVFVWSAVVRNEFWIFGKELPLILKTFRDAGLEAMLLKGAVMAMLHYKDRSLRLFGDIDFLLRREQLHQAAELLFGIGFSSQRQSSGDGRGVGPERKSLPPLVKFAGSGQRLMLDLHWRLSEKYPVDMGRIWERGEAIQVGQERALAPCVEHRLYHVCLHAASHGFSPAVWDGSPLTMMSICDINELFSHNSQDFVWDEFERMAVGSRIEQRCHDFLRLSKVLLDANVPESGLARLRQEAAGRSVSVLWEKRAARFLQRKPDDVFRFAYNLVVPGPDRESPWRRFRRRCFPPVAAVARHYGVADDSVLKYLCYVRRLVRPSIIRKGTLLALRLGEMFLRRLLRR